MLSFKERHFSSAYIAHNRRFRLHFQFRRDKWKPPLPKAHAWQLAPLIFFLYPQEFAFLLSLPFGCTKPGLKGLEGAKSTRYEETPAIKPAETRSDSQLDMKKMESMPALTRCLQNDPKRAVLDIFNLIAVFNDPKP